MRDLIIADNVHGESDWMARACLSRPLRQQNCSPSKLMASVLRESQEPVTLVASGPQTNVALLPRQPSGAAREDRPHLIMGRHGSMGNWQPAAAEFNNLR